jgi:methionyl-tRNA formyltransferase
MRIGYFADGIWSHSAFDKIVSDERFQITFVVLRYHSPDEVLKQKALELGIDCLHVQNVNSPENQKKIKRYKCDVFVSMSFDQIFKSDFLNITPLGVVNCHAGALPFYRGRNVLNWVLINDSSSFGVTVHYVDEGIDTGDIILQRHYPIQDSDDYGTLLQKASVACSELLYQSLVMIHDGKALRTRQSDIHPVGFYCGKRLNGDEWIDWEWSSRRIFNFVRGITEPGPCACTAFNGHKLLVKTTSLIENAIDYIGTPGEVVGRTGDDLCVKTGDSTIWLLSINKSRKKSNKIKIGNRFQSKFEYLSNK